MSKNDTKKHEQDLVYEQLGLDVPEDANINDMHENTDSTVEALEQVQKEMGVTVVNKADHKLENGDDLILTNKVAFQDSKVALGRLPIWYLNALGSMTEEEYKDFTRTYSGKLSINEIAAGQLLERVRKGEKDAVQTFWNIQIKLLNKTNVVNQVNVQVTKPDSVVSNLLDKIADNIREADAATGNFTTTPTP